MCSPTIGTKLSNTWRLTLLWSSVGVHPHFAEPASPSFENFFSHSQYVGLGEGIDLNSGCLCPPNCCVSDCVRIRQIGFLRKVLPLAKVHDKTLVFYCRGTGAYQLVLDLLQELELTSLRIHLHCFTGGEFTVESWLSVCPHVYFGISPLLLQDRYLQDTVGNIPLDRIVLESDAPYLPKYKNTP